MPIKGILFDFDGTLANTTDLILAAFDHTFTRFLKRRVPREEIIKTFGLPLADAMAMYAPSPAMITDMRAVYRQFNLEHHDEMIKSISGVADALTALYADGIKMAVVTSKKSPMANRGLKCCGLEAFISAVVGCDDTENNKPHPEPMLKACKMLDLLPQECICVGDSPYDLQSGKRAGALTAAVRYTSFEWQVMLQEGKPDFVLDNMLDLLPIIDKLNFSEEVRRNA